MLDRDFCEKLEHLISEALENSSDENVKGFWCDGVFLSEPENCYSQKFVNDNKQTKMKVYVGKDGQSSYELTLRFGIRSLSKYVRGLYIADGFPKRDRKNRIKVDVSIKKIELLLD